MTNQTPEPKIAYEIRSVTSPTGEVEEIGLLQSAERVHRQLRTKLPDDYVAKMHLVFAGGGRMCVALRGDKVIGLAVYRLIEETLGGRQIFVDDLVTDEAQRSTGVGTGILAFLEQEARRMGCWTVTLDSGVQRANAHKFYFREGYRIVSYHFAKDL